MMCLQSYTQPMNLCRNMTVSTVMQCSQSMWPQYSFHPAKYPHKSTLKVKSCFFLSGSCGDIVLFRVMLFCHHTGPQCVRHFPQQSILSLLLTSPVMIKPLYSLCLCCSSSGDPVLIKRTPTQTLSSTARQVKMTQLD